MLKVHGAHLLLLTSTFAMVTLAGSDRLNAGDPVENSIGMKLIEIPAGEFTMGAEALRSELYSSFSYAPRESFESEMPQHKVRITKPFLMGQFEVTLGQFQEFCNASNYKVQAEADGKPTLGYWEGEQMKESDRFRPWDPVAWKPEPDYPATFVSWNDAIAFCKWLSEKESVTYRLPTEAEWEYACRAGSSKRFSFGDDPEELVQFGNVFDRDRLIAMNPLTKDKKFPMRHPAGGDGFVWAAPVGSFKPNAFGLYDMHGNTWEWCSDWFAENYYRSSPSSDPKGPETGTARVMRGGGFDNAVVWMRCATRAGATPSTRGSVSGFRVVREK